MVKRYKGAKGKADKLFSLLVRAPGQCQRCGATNNLQCAHIISRRYSATRTDLRNAWVLCASCHRRLTDWPREHSRYITDTIGSDLYEELQRKAETVTKVDWDAELDRLRGEARQRGIQQV